MTVRLVGAGPGDPGLITVRGLELVRTCDALVHDRLVAPELVGEAPEDALVISRDGMSQERVNELLVSLGRAGLEVVRLKGGDPFVFGRGGEEVEVLEAAGLDVEVVPGVSSIAAVPAAAGIPVTHRGVSDRVTAIAGTSADGGDLDFEALASTGGTIVVFMGLARAGTIAAGLVRAGLAPDTPAAAISNGTLAEQAAVVTTLDRLEQDSAELTTPALLVIGAVVGLARVPRRAAAGTISA